MGLDMYAYVATKPGAQEEYYEEVNANRTTTQPRELAYWRKHPNLHGWMEELYYAKGGDVDTFNGVEVELTWEDLDELEKAILNDELPDTKGFFFGDPSDDYYKQKDLTFIKMPVPNCLWDLKYFIIVVGKK